MNEKTQEAKFKFQNFKIIKSVIELSDNDEKISDSFKLHFTPKGSIVKNNNIFQLHLETSVQDENDVLNIIVIAKADFMFSDSIEPNMLNNMFYVNAPAILFPYIRAYISTLSTLSGIKAITLPTMNLKSLGKKLSQNTKEV